MTTPQLQDQTLRHAAGMVARYPALAALEAPVTAAARLLCRCHRARGTLLFCGNGGSAADCEHIVGELMKGFALPRRIPPADAARLEAAGFEDARELADRLQCGIAAIALTGHAALSTAVLNDTHGNMVFAQQVYAYGRPGDVLVGLSTSGSSENVLNALKVARAFGLATIGFTGSRPAKMDALCDIVLKVPAEETFKIQEYHLPLYHTLCLMVECELFGECMDGR